MKLDIRNSEDLLPAKVLHNIPDIMDEKDLKNTCGKRADITIVDLGNLTNLKKFMVKNSDKANCNYNSSMKEEGMWSGTNTWGEYIKLLDEGDDDVMKKIKVETTKQVAELGKKYKEIIQHYHFDVAGEFFDVGLVMTGVPESWLQPTEDEEEVVKVDILINGAFSARVDEKDIVNSSSRILSMIKILEDHKVQVSLKMINANVDYDDTYSRSLISIITLKDYSEPVNYRKLSSIMSPAHHRRGLFKIMEVSEPKLGSGYGSPRGLKNCIDLHDKRAIDKLERKLFKGK